MAGADAARASLAQDTRHTLKVSQTSTEEMYR